MRPLADLQARIARAVVTGDSAPAVGLVAGPAADRRLAIHLRHFEASLTAALCQKYPATAWLAGAEFLTEAARAYLRAHPPRRPCIAEYGGDFPEFLTRFGRAPALPYLESFGVLEWAVGNVAIAVDRPPLAWADVAAAGTERLLEARVALQPGARYVRAGWRIDALMKMYLAGGDAAAFELAEQDTCIEVRGARGELSIERIDPATFAFRTSLGEGRSIGDAAEAALECDRAFDAGRALLDVVRTGLAAELLTDADGGSQRTAEGDPR